MASYAAIAVGLINLRYQTGTENNFLRSTVLILPGVFLLGLSFIVAGKNFLQTRTAAAIVIACGGLLLAYSFML